MARSYKTSYKTRRAVKRFKFGIAAPAASKSEEEKLLEKIANEEEFIKKYQDGYPSLCDEARSRIGCYRKELEVLRTEKAAEAERLADMKQLTHTYYDFNPGGEEENDSALTHIDSLMGEQRLPTLKMIDAAELFIPKNYNNKAVPGRTCPKCGGGLIVKERRLRQRGREDYVTNFVACVMWERTGCNHTEDFTAQIKESIDSAIHNVDIEF